MIVFDLKCDRDHRFEGWFGATAEYQQQQEKGLLSCPMCGSSAVGKAPMAPSIASARGIEPKQSEQADKAPQQPGPDSGKGAPPEVLAKAVAAMAALQAEVLKKSKWVGNDFAECSRAMHYGEEEAAVIHGRADQQEAEALLEEGISVAPLLIAFTPPEEVN